MEFDDDFGRPPGLSHDGIEHRLGAVEQGGLSVAASEALERIQRETALVDGAVSAIADVQAGLSISATTQLGLHEDAREQARVLEEIRSAGERSVLRAQEELSEIGCQLRENVAQIDRVFADAHSRLFEGARQQARLLEEFGEVGNRLGGWLSEQLLGLRPHDLMATELKGLRLSPESLVGSLNETVAGALSFMDGQDRAGGDFEAALLRRAASLFHLSGQEEQAAALEIAQAEVSRLRKEIEERLAAAPDQAEIAGERRPGRPWWREYLRARTVLETLLALATIKDCAAPQGSVSEVNIQVDVQVVVAKSASIDLRAVLLRDAHLRDAPTKSAISTGVVAEHAVVVVLAQGGGTNGRWWQVEHVDYVRKERRRGWIYGDFLAPLPATPQTQR